MQSSRDEDRIQICSLRQKCQNETEIEQFTPDIVYPTGKVCGSRIGLLAPLGHSETSSGTIYGYEKGRFKAKASVVRHNF